LLESGHRLRLTVTTFDFPHLVPTKPARRALTAAAISFIRAARFRRIC
jgi:hypothetical protein